MNILHVTAPAPVGGLERVVTALARGHAAQGHAVHVVSVFDEGAAGAALGRDIAGVMTHIVTVPRRRYWRERAAVAGVTRSVDADVLHTHGYRPDVVDSAVGRALGIPTVSTVHGFTGGGVKNRLFERLQLRAYRSMNAVIAVSRPLVARLVAAGVPEALVHCIPNAWCPDGAPATRADARRLLGLPSTGLVAGWIGRLSPEKAPDTFLEALHLLSDDALTGVVIGAGPMAAALARYSTALRVPVRLCGQHDGAAALMSAFDVFVLSSRTEGTPIVLFEAMAAGIPVVATQVGGVPDVVSGREALLVPPGDPAALARGIHQSLQDRDGAALRVAAARDRLERQFAAGPWLGRYERLYRHLGAERASP